MKKVSVCMLAYNSEKYISEAIESVMMQETNFEIELVIADDKSTDDTIKILEVYKLRYPEVIKLLLNPVNIGMSANYMNALRHCSAPYIAMLDGDDYWRDPCKLQRQIDFLEQNRDFGMVYTDCNTVDAEGNEFEWDQMQIYRKRFSSGMLFFRLLAVGGFIQPLTACFRTSLISDELRRSDLWFFEDWWLWMRIAAKAKCYFLNSITASYRVHAAQVTKTRIKDDKPMKMYRKKCYAIYYSNITYFSKSGAYILDKDEQELFFRKILMLLYRPQGSIAMKMRLIPLVFKHYPGITSIKQIVSKKLNKGNRLQNTFIYAFLNTPSYLVEI